MNEKTVPAAQPPSEPSVWADIAAELHRIADDCMDLVGEPAPAMFELNIQPGKGNTLEAVSAVDFAANVLLGVDAETKHLSGGTHHRTVRGHRGPVSVWIYQQVPVTDRREDELAQLREENARLRAAAGLDHSRDDGPVDAHAGRVPPHLEDGRSGHVIEVADGHVVHECCGKVDDGPHMSFCQYYVRPSAETLGRNPGEAADDVVHFENRCGESYCGFAPTTVRNASRDWRQVTCDDCRKAAPGVVS